MSHLLNILIGFLSVALTFGIAVFVHELGHFLAARVRGVGVEAFAVGMGPKIVSWTRGGTEYSLRWLPFGGFVKLHHMVREEAEEAARERELAQHAGDEKEKENDQGADKSLGQAAYEDMVALYNQGLLTKMMVFTAGVTFNVLAAMVAVATLAWVGFDVPLPPETRVVDIAPDSPFAQAGLREGDFMIEVDGAPVKNGKEALQEMEQVLKSGKGASGLNVKIRRDNEILPLTLPPLTEENKALYVEKKNWWDTRPYIGEVVVGLPADKAGLQRGDLIVAVNDKPIQWWSEMSRIVRKNPNEAIALAVQRRGVDHNIKLSLVPDPDPMQPQTGIIGIVSGSAEMERVTEPFVRAVIHAPGRTVVRLAELAVGQYMALREIISHSGAKGLSKSLGGPIAIARQTYRQAQLGLSHALDWFINLNLLLAVLNLLPIPVLDGGFVVLAILEATIRRPVSTKILNPVYTVFVLAFIALAIFVSYNDILNKLF